MDNILLASQTLTWLLLLATGAVTLLLSRRVRAFYRVVAPAGALMTSGGLPSGAVIPTASLTAMDGSTISIGGKRATSQLILFVSESCPISRKMIPIAREFCRSESIDLLFFGDDREDVQTALIQEFSLNPTRFINSESYGRTIGIDKLPYALLAGQDGRLIARGLVNSREHLESLMTVQETGFDTVQSWLSTRDARTA